MTVQVAPTESLDTRTLYSLLQLRSAVFVVEQDCAYADLDGRDLEPETRQLWIARDGEVLATLRLLADPAGARIGRVATARAERGAGHAGELMRAALDQVGASTVVLDAQAHLEAWYGRFGFVRDGENFLEDGIWHVPMRRPAPTTRIRTPRNASA